MQPLSLLAFLSDFGLEDPYVGIVKGVLLGINPALQIVDLTHKIPRQDVAAGAFALGSAYRNFPSGTTFLAVVDPGVGSERIGLLVITGPYAFIAPDNGLLTLILRQAPSPSCYRLAEERYFRHPVSATFHARDVFAPVAAHLSLGVEPSAIGPAHSNPVYLPWPEPRTTADGLLGEVIHVDRFGNLITNVDDTCIRKMPPGRPRTVEIAGNCCSLLRTYADAPRHALLGLIGSSGFLEVAVNRGSAAILLGVGTGEHLLVR